MSDILGAHGPIDIDERVETWRESGWDGYNPNAKPYTAAEIEAERERYY
ncbi:MAG: hypothetical protein KDJ52_20065 [Anaerolineae bacterium]|nr:hypothetical protein [Anaerolineae bacterium]